MGIDRFSAIEVRSGCRPAESAHHLAAIILHTGPQSNPPDKLKGVGVEPAAEGG